MPMEAWSEDRGMVPARFLTLALLVGGRVINTAPATLPPEETPSTNCTGGWVGPDSPTLSSTDIRPQIVQPVASNCTNWYFDIVIFVNCNWVDTRWQQYSTHLHTNNTQNNTIKNLLEGFLGFKPRGGQLKLTN